jgi:hypothetical protein
MNKVTEEQGEVLTCRRGEEEKGGKNDGRTDKRWKRNTGERRDRDENKRGA